MHSHYIEISVSENLDGAAFFARVLFRLHGFCEKQETIRLGVDFPNWTPAKRFTGTGTGNVLRIFGSKEHLGKFLSMTGLIQFLIEGGVSLSGISAVPSDITGYVHVRRNQAIERHIAMLRDPKSIPTVNIPEVIPDNIRAIAEQNGVDVRTVLAVEQMQERILKEKRAAAVLNMRSKSTGNKFSMYIDRMKAKYLEGVGRFSTYGFSVEGACVPTW
ncbi:type I-F CRISPR-associated endoribonuclease Cas6/Csy4 [Pseudomonas aeruginosa]